MKDGDNFFARERVSRLGLGVWTTFGERVDFARAKRIFRTARDFGLNHFDAAADYADGRGESFLGRLADDECFLSTKIAAPPNPAEAARAVESAINAALSRLRRGRLDLLYCRAPTDAVLPLLPGIFDRQIREGKIARWGVSNWPPQMLREALVVCRAGGFAAPAAAQAPGSFLFVAPLFSLCDLAAKNKIALVGYSPFARGVLAGRYLRGVPRGSRLADSKQARHIRCGEEEKKIARALAKIAAKTQMPLARMTLTHAFSRLPVAALIAGASSPMQIRQWAAAADEKLPEDILQEIDAVFARRVKHPVLPK